MFSTSPKDSQKTKNQAFVEQIRTPPSKAARKGYILGWTMSKRAGLRLATRMSKLDEELPTIASKHFSETDDFVYLHLHHHNSHFLLSRRAKHNYINYYPQIEF